MSYQDSYGNECPVDTDILEEAAKKNPDTNSLYPV